MRAFTSGTNEIRYDYVYIDYLRQELGSSRSIKGRARQEVTRLPHNDELDQNKNCQVPSAEMYLILHEEKLLEKEMTEAQKKIEKQAHLLKLEQMRINAKKATQLDLDGVASHRECFLKLHDEALKLAKRQRKLRIARTPRRRGKNPALYVDLVCLHCGTGFKRRSKLFNPKTKKFFCSHPCYSEEKRGKKSATRYRKYKIAA